MAEAATCPKPEYKPSKTDAPGEVQSNTRKIQWLASYPKSGNTWVRMFLNAYATGFPLRINSAYQYVTTDLRPEVFQMMMPRSLAEMTLGEQFMYHQGALLNMIKLSSTRDVVCKTHHAKAVVEGVHLIPARISGPSVYIVRDPRDVVLSHAEHFSETLEDSITAMERTDRIGQTEFRLSHMFMDWTSHVKSWTVQNKDVDTLCVRYEDLFEPKAFKEIVNQLGLEFDEERFAFALEESGFENLQKYEAENSFGELKGGERFFRVGKTGQWKDKLSKSQRRRIEQRHKEMMQLYGYL